MKNNNIRQAFRIIICFIFSIAILSQWNSDVSAASKISRIKGDKNQFYIQLGYHKMEEEKRGKKLQCLHV